MLDGPSRRGDDADDVEGSWERQRVRASGARRSERGADDEGEVSAQRLPFLSLARVYGLPAGEVKQAGVKRLQIIVRFPI